ncbi:hypothetical protein D3C87_2101480 [compost metagenome]
MLEEVGVQILLLHLQVGLHVVGEHAHLQLHPLLGQQRLDHFEDLRVRHRGGGDVEGLCLGGDGEGGEQGRGGQQFLHC